MELKKVTLALMALGVSGVASAAAYVPAPAPAPACVGENVTVPCPEDRFSFGADFIYVQPTGNLTYNDNSNLKWAPGFKLEGSYLFGTGNDVTINATWFENTGRRDVTRLNGNAVQQAVKDTFWNINVEFGQTAHYGENVTMRYHAGMQYADIKRTFDPFNSQLGVIQVSEQRFQGFGPRFGVDAAYEIYDSGFAVVGKAAGSLLIGDAKANVRDVNSANDFGDIRKVSTRTVAPGLEARLGGKYTFDTPQIDGDFVIEGGYQWAGYFQTMHNGFEEDNYGYHGIYVGLKWIGDIAI